MELAIIIILQLVFDISAVIAYVNSAKTLALIFLLIAVIILKTLWEIIEDNY